MKLLFCPFCDDLIKLTREGWRTCSCGKVGGMYNRDGKHAIVNGEGYSLAIDNISLGHAIRHQDEKHPVMLVNCWLRPHEGPYNNRCKIEKEPTNEQ